MKLQLFHFPLFSTVNIRHESNSIARALPRLIFNIPSMCAFYSHLQHILMTTFADYFQSFGKGCQN